MNTPIDYRSDTVTRPTPGMLSAIHQAAVGDDVFGEDPSINELEARTASYFGFEAGLYCPSGTMTNQIAIKCHTQPGDEVICDINSHIYQYEGGGIAFNSSASVKLLEGDRGRVTATQVKTAIQPDDVHRAHTSLVSLENTSNRGGGSCYDLKEIESIRNVCAENGLRLHLDGARVWNAIVAKKENPKDYVRLFHSASVCFSKSMGCPVGSVLLGDADFIKKARRIRKVFGGGMRQAGYLAAAGVYALDHHIDRLAEDHAHAQLLSEEIAKKSFVKFVLPVETNILMFELVEGKSAPGLVADLKQHGILAYAIAPNRVRLVTHLDISRPMIDTTLSAFRSL
ncbi:MAG: aminotransferase class I/II-fold pyridoxal phosphate-dependent enzyme [Bacteroidetes bacterium]|nr:aminotransferase class I/II-fold pyridoxal phosphate-dependent enzyme [Bacteroidota bacterium]